MDCILLFYRRPVSGSIPNQPGVAVTGRFAAAENHAALIHIPVSTFGPTS